jgi:hypothetical protein
MILIAIQYELFGTNKSFIQETFAIIPKATIEAKNEKYSVTFA